VQFTITKYLNKFHFRAALTTPGPKMLKTLCPKI
jgi:hypothetical protein